MSYIELKDVHKSFNRKNGNILNVIENVSVNIHSEEFVTFFGPNGCGKSTLLNIIAGIEKASGGKVLINRFPPEMVKTGFVFQNYNESMLPWRTAAGNIEFALEVQGYKKKFCREKAEFLLDKIGLLDFRDKYFYELSGGMKQLVAICRAFAYDPEIFIMDEPFSALDYSTTRKMEMELLSIWEENPRTTLFVSHDVDEAIFIADRVIVLSKRPCVIKEIVEVNLPRPRKIEMLYSDELFRIRKKILEHFDYEE